MFIYTFQTPIGEAGPCAGQTGWMIQGDDWLLDETLGTSYEVLSQTLDGDMVVTECRQRPTNWVGSLFLERVNVPYRIVTRTPDGILIHHGLWKRLLWKGARPLTRDEVRSF